MIRKNQWLVGLGLILSGLLIFYFAFVAYDYLCFQKSSESDILVAEGWLPDDALDKVKQEFEKGKYRVLITTGFPFHNGYPMGTGGTTEFEIYSQVEVNNDNQYAITVTLKGTPAKKAFPHIWVFADSIRIGETFASRYKEDFTFTARLDSTPRKIRIVFDNDTYTKYADRNLLLYSVTVNGCIFPANDNHVIYYRQREGKVTYLKNHTRSSATDAANYLVNAGIPDSLVIPVETHHRYKSKTYTTALDVKKWLVETNPTGNRSIMLFSRGVHARRSYISYKRAFGDQVYVGIICSPDPFMTRSDWWRSTYGWKKMLYETAGVLYATVVL